ncbi:MAG TPA: response regulator [Bacteriovoracaceae bacterium]|nr:response regulator [Bacteriovoracaceae bacterium]
MDEEILKGKTLLVVDDEVDLRDIVASELEFMGAKVFQAENIHVAQKILEKQQIDLVVSDIRMPGGTGIDLLDYIKAKDVNYPPIILITGFADITVEKAFNKGAEALMNKPFKLDDLIKTVVKYISPTLERLKSTTAETTKNIEQDMHDEECDFGRGGISLRFNTEGKKFEVGETLRFDLKYKTQQLKGTGICRWYKGPDQVLHKASMGLEFVELTGPTFDRFQKVWEEKKIIPFIPSLEAH